MATSQPGILPEIPARGRYIELRALPGHDLSAGLKPLLDRSIDAGIVVGFGAALVGALGAKITDLRAFPAMSGPSASVPSTQADLWIWLRGDDQGDLMLAAAKLTAELAPTYEVTSVLDGFRHREGRDLTGYEDGTENPEGDDAVEASFAPDGSSFVAVQTWQHDLAHFASLPAGTRDAIIGRRIADNSEIDDAPDSAHVKRTAQENFDPEAFLVRRSMPWVDGTKSGLHLVAFGKSFAAFEAQMTRMLGIEDGVTDGLFEFSKAQTGAYYWCPPLRDGKLDLHIRD